MSSADTADNGQKQRFTVLANVDLPTILGFIFPLLYILITVSMSLIEPIASYELPFAIYSSSGRGVPTGTISSLHCQISLVYLVDIDACFPLNILLYVNCADICKNLSISVILFLSNLVSVHMMPMQ